MENKESLNKKIKEIFAFEEYFDKKFPKGDKRRGEAMALLGILYAKVFKANEEAVRKLKEDLEEWIGESSLVDIASMNIIVNKIFGDKLIGKEAGI